ncbi:DUF4012 domain-containing protein [Pseudarthrobacter phenanthrenivorans]|uniref:DUF4012 domain-containing protein n=1 Tax=Pseudarthrobacter phenanthrenivorans TaxID=361575 RepID=A0A3B0FNP8_PSEPS|nr:DUF4012 domain-containing protein [Pseudarthrobacter phenanthrenivorans]RKO21529.1 DUF4012 domain-containing protein [Pseudarthrobacter phenanthrenivorans]TPV52590.1 DUF4012 domain-containing protein [Pseudarthrobacter phenanthrenivorans]
MDSKERLVHGGNGSGSAGRGNRRRRLIATIVSILLLVALALVAAAALAAKASAIRAELESAKHLVTGLRINIAANKPEAALQDIGQLKQHTSAARSHSTGALWTAARLIPWIGANFQAASEITASADDVVQLGAEPLVTQLQSFDWDSLAPNSTGIDLEPLEAAEPRIASAAHAVRASAQRINEIDGNALVPQISGPLAEIREELNSASSSLDAAASAASLLPDMLGSEEPRHYLLLIQNNAEVRASGGIAGALAVLSVDDGKIELGSQSSATEMGAFLPPLPVPEHQKIIFSERMGKFVQDVNLTPAFPTAAGLAQEMWERKTGQRVHGVVAIDPVFLSYLLEATGPVQIANTRGLDLGLPTKLNADNLVSTLLSDVYAAIPEPATQDQYFASVAADIFNALSAGKTDPKRLIEGMTRGVEEGRILIWSDTSREQAILANHRLSGSIDGPSVSAAQFGVYFNDGTGAKMDYYMQRTVQLVRECPRDGYEETTVRVTSTNTAPSDAASSLSAYVTGDGIFGVPPGSVQTNIIAYGPVQAQVESAKLDGQKTGFTPHIHRNRPVGILAVRLAPGESRTVDFTFGKIVQHTEPSLVVTPTLQDVKDVTLPTEIKTCG